MIPNKLLNCNFFSFPRSVIFQDKLIIFSRFYSLNYVHNVSFIVPGKVSCIYFGSLPESCEEANVPVTNLPKEIESLFYVDVVPNASLSVAFGYSYKSNDGNSIGNINLCVINNS